MINSLDHTFIDYFIIDPTEKEVGQSMAILRTGYFKQILSGHESRFTMHHIISTMQLRAKRATSVK